MTALSGHKLPKFGYQPIRNIILDDGRTIAGFVRRLRTDHAHAHLAISGRVPPSPELRAELIEKLHLPLDALFTGSALGATYRPQHRSGMAGVR